MLIHKILEGGIYQTGFNWLVRYGDDYAFALRLGDWMLRGDLCLCREYWWKTEVIFYVVTPLEICNSERIMRGAGRIGWKEYYFG